MLNEKDLKKVGLKVTMPRLRVLQIFQESHSRHLTADDVYKELLADDQDIGLATVYRVLTQFEQAGILTRLNFETGKSVFELSPDDHHDHLVCLKCGKVEEFHDAEIEKRQHEVSKKHGFTLESHALSLYGLCRACGKELK